MHKHNVLQTIKVAQGGTNVAAGSTDSNGDVIDVSGCSSVCFAVLFGTITGSAVTGVKVQAGSAANGSDMADVTNSAISVADTNSGKTILSTEIFSPTKRYYRCVVTRATQNAVINGIVALLGRPSVAPPALGLNVGNTSLPGVLVSVP